MSARSFWPPVQAAQVDYETLRTHALEQSGLPGGLAAARFARRGLAGLIAWPAAEPVFVAELLAAARPAWTPHEDPRVAALAAGYEFRAATSSSATHTANAAVAHGRRWPNSPARVTPSSGRVQPPHADQRAMPGR